MDFGLYSIEKQRTEIVCNTKIKLSHCVVLCRRVQLPEGGADLQARVLLLPDHHLRALLHAGHRILGLLLAGPERHSCQVRPLLS